MPDLANITVKKADGTTDITYTGIQPSSGDKSPAVWKSQSVGSALAHQPELRVSARSNATRTARQVTVNVSYPALVTSADTGITSVLKRFNMTAEASVPTDVPTALTDEATAQACNLMASALMKEMMKTGYSAS